MGTPRTLEQTVAKLETLKREMAAPSANLQACAKALSELKIELTTFPAMAPCARPDIGAVNELTIARDVYETGALLSIQMEDPDAFERHISQLKTFYVDYAGILPPSSKQNVILALNLMGLLAMNRVAEFHTELELIPMKLRSNEYIAFVLHLEQYLMEGSYAKINASQRPPDPAFRFFLDTLMVTVRDEIAACSERSYKQLSVDVARKLLSFDSESDFLAFATERNWVIRDGMIRFVSSEKESEPVNQILSMGLVRRALNYAKELEQIV